MSFLRTLAHRRAARRASSEEDIRSSGYFYSSGDHGGIVLGSWRDRKGRSHLLQYKGAEPVLVIGPCRSGKGVGVSVPTLLNWNDSALIYDVKGENWAVTSGYRARRLGQRVLKFDPSAPESARFNPLQEIRLDRNMISDAHDIATMIADPDGHGLKDHWVKSGRNLIRGILLFVMLCGPPEATTAIDRNLTTVLEILSDGGPFREAAARAAFERAQYVGWVSGGVFSYVRDIALAKIRAVKSDERLAEDDEGHASRQVVWQAIAESMDTWLNKPANEAGSVLSTALTFLSLYRDPIVADNTRVSDFSIQSVIAPYEKTSLYVVVHPSHGGRYRSLANLVMKMAIRRRIEIADEGLRADRLLLFIDDIASFSHLNEKCVKAFRRCGVNLLALAQSRPQLRRMNNEVLLENCGIQIAFTPSEYDTAEMFAAGCGLTAHEILRLPQDEVIVFVPFGDPIYCKRAEYYSDDGMRDDASCGASAFTGRMS